MSTQLFTDQHQRTIAHVLNGTADYLFAKDAPPAWLVAAVPGAQQAFDAWKEQNRVGLELLATWKTSGAEVMAARDGRALAPVLELAERKHEADSRAVTAQANKALRALNVFDKTVYGIDAIKYKTLAATVTLAALDDARDALAALTAAYSTLDTAYTAAGRPLNGRDPREAGTLAREFDGGARTSLDNMAAILGAFPVPTISAVAAGARGVSKSEADLANEHSAMLKAAAAKHREDERAKREAAPAGPHDRQEVPGAPVRKSHKAKPAVPSAPTDDGPEPEFAPVEGQ